MVNTSSSRLYYSTETDRKPFFPGQLRLGLEARYDYRVRRMVIHIDRMLHKRTPENPDGETVYMDGQYYPEAMTGDSVWEASQVAHELKPFALHAGNHLMGVRIAASNTDPYLSKVIFYAHPEVNEDEIFAAIARALEVEFADTSAMKFDTIEPEQISPTETKEIQEFRWNQLFENDIDYSY